jgi:hypothetical protein
VSAPWRLFRLWWRHGRRAADFAAGALYAQECCGGLRRADPGRSFCWGFQPKDRRGNLVAFYESFSRGVHAPGLERLWYGDVWDADADTLIRLARPGRWRDENPQWRRPA